MTESNEKKESNSKNSEDIEMDPIYLMDEIIDKLKVLEYESLFLKQKY